MKRTLLLLLIISSCCFSLSYGPSVVKVERTWTVQSKGNYSFEGMLTINDSNQKVLGIETEPKMAIVTDEQGNIRVQYNGSSRHLRAVAIMALDFNTNITKNPVFSKTSSLNATNLTMWDANIAAAADNLTAGTTLETVRNIVNFIRSYVAYNDAYFNIVLNATETYAVRQGVCVEYSHLAISMARYLGMETKFVSGFVNGGEWQPHAWIEIYVPEYGWVPADPTFGEIGMLDNSHVARAKGVDQNEMFDFVQSSVPEDDIKFSESSTAEFVEQNDGQKGRSITYAFGTHSHDLNITLKNNRSDYAFGTYMIVLPAKTGVNVSTVVLLAPYENRTITYQMNESMFVPGYHYIIPFMASLDGASVKGDLAAIGPVPEDEEPEAAPCAFTYAVLALAAMCACANAGRVAG